PALVDEPEAEAPAAWFDDEEDTSDPLADAFISTGLDEEDSPVGVESPSVEPEPEPEPVEDDWVLEKRPEVADVAGDFEVEPLETIESTVEDARNEPIEHAEGFETHTFVPDDPESSSVYMGEAAAAESDDEEVSYGLDDALVSDGLEDALILPPDEADDEADVSADEPEVSRNQEASPVTQSGGGSLADLMAAADTDHATEAPPAPPARPVQAFTFGQRTPEEKAQRLARVLVSDMIMYNPERHQRAVANGTLREDFDDEIEKSWKEYVEQVGEEMASRTDFWTEALNEVLARGEQIF
ncbi:MAG: hypothetical protein OEZ65_05870, partial [Gemmatimonadota bacterium]|nr:hypothetical protein [Gemmatimonadota bacterium]